MSTGRVEGNPKLLYRSCWFIKYPNRNSVSNKFSWIDRRAVLTEQE